MEDEMLGEEVLINFHHRYWTGFLNTNVETDHEASQLLSIHKDHSGWDIFYILNGSRGETARSNEDT